MGFRLSAAARSAACNAVVDSLDGGTTPVLEIYSGTQPTNPDTAIGAQVLLVSFNMDGTAAFGAASTGVATITGLPLSATGVAAGTAAWFRMKTQTGGTAVCDGTVTASGGGGNIILSTTTISVGVTVEITSGTVTMPLGT